MNKIQDLFNDNPILAKIGTPKQYAEYLNTIFPNSKVKEILYHGAMEQLLPKDNFKGYITYFTDIKNYAETFGFPINRKVISAVIDVKSPYRAPSELADVPDNIHNSDEFTNPRIIKSQNKGFDSVIGKDAGQKEGNTVAVFEPEQIHILGSKEDIEKFKKYTEKNIKENMNSFKIFSKEWWKKSLDLHESPPNNFENDDNHQYVEDNLSSINKAAIVFNFPVEDMQLAFNGASSLVLMDDVWSNLENSNSYNIQSLGQALLYAKKHKIDPVPYLEAIKNMESLPKPLVLRYDTDKYYLVNGEFVLSLQKALNMTPDILQATINVKIKEDGDQEDEINLVNEFISYVKEDLGLVQTPKIEFSDDTDHVKEQSSFGYFSPDSNIVWVYTGDRNMADVFRTLAHELVHRKQDEDGKINYNSGETGSDIENEANAKAGILLRDFGKKHNDIYDTPIKKFIKNGLSEVKIEQPGINFTFPFWITKQNKSQAPFFADQLNKQGYTLNGRKIEVEDITFNIPTILDYDSNYRDKPERKILNTYSPAYEVKIQQPINYKKAYGEVHSYDEMQKWKNENAQLPSHFLIDVSNNKVLAGFQDMNIPKWAWDLNKNNDIPTEDNKFYLASKSSITNPPPYLNTPNIDVTNPSSWGNISKVKQYIKN